MKNSVLNAVLSFINESAMLSTEMTYSGLLEAPASHVISSMDLDSMRCCHAWQIANLDSPSAAAVSEAAARRDHSENR
jgi:hypothetical protein